MKYIVVILFSTCAFANSNYHVPDEIEPSDLKKISDLRPTTYYIPSEGKVSCKGKYGKKTYSGKEIQKLLTPEGMLIATVCGRFASVLLMEGSGVLKDEGHGEIVINYARTLKGLPRYRVLDRCQYGQGVKSLCLLPYHTIAADNRIHKVNEIIFIPAAKGLLLPDGSIHDGTFIVRDTGGAFKGAGAQRVDLFVGTDPDSNNAFQKAGFDKTRTFKAFKVKAESAERIKDKLKEKFRDLF